MILSVEQLSSCNDDEEKVRELEYSHHPVPQLVELRGKLRNGSSRSLKSFVSRISMLVMHVLHKLIIVLSRCLAHRDLSKHIERSSSLILSGFTGYVRSCTCRIIMYNQTRCGGDHIKLQSRFKVADLISITSVSYGIPQNRPLQRALGMQRRFMGRLLLMARFDHCCYCIACLCRHWGLRIGRSIHGYVVRAGLGSLVAVCTALMNMYSKCGLVGVARLIFDGMRERNVVTWNSMIDGYAESGDSEEAIKLFEKMMGEGFQPTDVTIMGALQACADLGDLKRGRFAHELAKKTGLESDVSIRNSLIAMYSKCKEVDIAAEIFKNTKGKTLVSWNAMILGYAQNGRANEALNLFCKMCQEDVIPDSFTMVSVVSAVAELSILQQAKWAHGLAIRSCLDRNVFVMTALVDMYAKCSGVHIARKLFDMMDVRHVMTWNAMIDGYGTHGLAKSALELFEKMLRGDVKPNGVTFLCVLSACGHSGLVDEGLHYFSSMKHDHGLEPGLDHYGSMVDILGRAGRLDEAWNFIQSMPIEPGISVYGAMLGACKIHKNVELGEKAAERIFELEPNEGGYHVLLANIYATASMWDKVAHVRKLMKRKGLQKTPGCSLVELGNEIHTFYSGSTTHPQSKRIYAKLLELGDEIKAAGYVPDSNSIHDVEDDVQEQLLNSHSEKLAIAFGLINTSAGTPIHIRKNLRVCGDCHSATKYISLVTKREIIVRDMQRFHHFKDGLCSCGDYW
ncbi:hypothetical protein Scep_015731 [Stephania cephalantha]|uniref:DYW domain-containing protein n=1 Tax=Stephania cephalantha TaxID=152367 RepID=A0AAP0J553_9MAGN